MMGQVSGTNIRASWCSPRTIPSFIDYFNKVYNWYIDELKPEKVGKTLTLDITTA